ncbi:syntaxin-like [Hylaeus volcanicus]|uniref:syntaxin-like n=1 Tax=Hylaeus volcanicus TaxID=313075 RepID=UPI0023B85862|nr:syntaxin-like [Hylaeus volcanicus]
MQDKLDDVRQEAAKINSNYIYLMRKGPSAVFLKDFEDDTVYVDENDNSKEKINEQTPDVLREFFSKIDVLKQGIVDLESYTKEIRSMKEKAIISSIQTEQEEISNALTNVLAKSTKATSTLKTKLDSLNKDNETFEAKNPNSAQTKIRRNTHAAIARKFRDTLKDLQLAQTEYKKELREKFTRQIELVVPGSTEQEVSKMIDSDVSPMSILRTELLQDVHEDTTNALSNIERKYEDIRLLEKNVTEMHQMFVDIATLVGAQGELLDQIQFSVDSAKDYAEKGQKEIVAVRETQIRVKRRTFCISICITGVAMVVLLVCLIALQR